MSDYEQYRIELLRERIKVEADIARDLWKLVKLLESIVEHSPWAMQIMSGVYRERGKP